MIPVVDPGPVAYSCIDDVSHSCGIRLGMLRTAAWWGGLLRPAVLAPVVWDVADSD